MRVHIRGPVDFDGTVGKGKSLVVGSKGCGEPATDDAELLGGL